MNEKQDPTDSYLILQYKKGNMAVLPTLVKRYHMIFCEKAYWVTKDKNTAKDVAQDSWITIINKLDTLRDSNSFRGWALRIVYTKAIDAVKISSKKSRDVRSTDLIDHAEQESNNRREDKEKALLKAIVKLPKDKQDVIRLFYGEEYSVAEISEFLGIPIGTVKSRLFKAREKLKSILKK